MGLASDLGYTYPPPNALQRGMQAFGATRGGAWFFSKTLRHLDRALHRATKGRSSVPELLAGLPVVMVTTTGRRSGTARTTPLIAPLVGDTLALVGTNFGSAATPLWVHNLEADPKALVEYQNTACSVRARPASPEEAAEIWRTANSLYGGYGKYQERITNREIRLFVLEPTED